MTEPLTAIDTAWLRMDQPTNPMMITAVLQLGEAVTRDEVARLVEEKLLVHARFRARVHDTNLPGVAPRWEVDPHFDPRNHVHALGLPAPRDRAAFAALVSDLASQVLDRQRPLWQLHVVDDAPGEGGRRGTALVVRLHHCLGDGVALVRLLLSLTDEGSAATPREPGRAAAPHGALDRARDLAAQTAALGRILLLPADPETAWRGPLGVRKELAFSRPFPLEGVRRAAARVGGKINDALLAACAGAARSDLLRRGWDGRRDVRCLVPVHVPGGRANDALGNHIGLVFVELPVTEPDREARLRAVRERTARVKEQPDATVALAVLAAMGVASRELEHVSVQVLAAKASALVTNVPGPTARVHLGGHPVEAMLVWAPVSGGIGLGFSLLSYAGEVRLGVSSDALRVPDPRGLVEDFERELEALVSAP